jgi:DNA-binding transcriptional ArsR family regulator
MPTRRNSSLDRPIAEIKADLFKALAHPGRIRILEVLSSGERSVSDLANAVDLELSHLSQQLGVLRRAGLVEARREGSSHFYSIRNPELPELLGVAKRLLLGNLEDTRALLSGLKASR